MRTNEYLFMLVKAYNPNQYNKLVERSIGDYASFLSITVLLAILIFIGALLPSAYMLSDDLDERLSSVDTLTIDGTIATDSPVILLDHPLVRIDSAANTTPSRTITIANDGLIYRKYLFFGERTLRWDSFKDLSNPSDDAKAMMHAIAAFLLPSIVFWFTVFVLIEVMIIYGIMVAVGTLAPKIVGFHAPASSVAKIGVLSLPSILFIDLGLYPIAPLFWWGFALTTVYFLIGVVMISEPKGASHSRKRSSDKN
ncbi:TPA: hypothetical protein HA251_04440 [Candidatus Woesearchaeota archaeon]|nr:hypothetical protein [Candidatus Woesearchaeota archaeon]